MVVGPTNDASLPLKYDSTKGVVYVSGTEIQPPLQGVGFYREAGRSLSVSATEDGYDLETPTMTIRLSSFIGTDKKKKLKKMFF